MYQYKATFFTTFYNNNLSSRTRNFMERFTNNFHHEQHGSYPRYGEMGHDISAFFLTAIQRYGNKLFNHIQQHDYNSLQLPMHFVRTAEGNGFTNVATYIIYYKNTGDVILSTF
jgi:multimeric flavodoxin WrbA